METKFKDLKQSTQDIVKDAILDAAKHRQGPEGYKLDEECIESIECESRDGFICASHNKGGLVYRNFDTLMNYWGGGHKVAHKQANNEIQRLIEISLDMARDAFYIDNTKKLKQLGIKDYQNINYGDLYELNASLGETLSEYEYENLSDDNSTVMHEFRFMYHGTNKGVHEASVSAAINTEGPYHRSSIPWQCDIFCEGAKEVTIKWRNNAELKRKLIKALKQVSKAIF